MMEETPYTTNKYRGLMRYDDTVFWNRFIFPSNTDIWDLGSVEISVAIDPDHGVVISCVPVKLLQESGFVHTTNGGSINIDLPFHLFFKGIDYFPILSLYSIEMWVIVTASKTYSFDVELILRSYDTQQRVQMVHTPHHFVGHQIYFQDQSNIKGQFVSNIIIRGYDRPKSVRVVINACESIQVDMGKLKSLDWDHDERINEQQKCECIRNALMSRYSVDTYVLDEIKERVGFTKHSLILPINSVVERIEFNNDFNSNVYYITDRKWRIEHGYCFW